MAKIENIDIIVLKHHQKQPHSLGIFTLMLQRIFQIIRLLTVNSQYIFNTTDSQEWKDVNFCNNSEVNLVEDPREYPVDMAWQEEE